MKHDYNIFKWLILTTRRRAGIQITKAICTIVLFFVITMTGVSQTVSPLQTGHYMTVFTNVRDMAKMSPGLFVLSYNYYAQGDSYGDRNGTRHDNIILDTINTRLDIDVSTFATAPAFFWGSKFTILGGATYCAGIVPNYYWANANIVARTGGGYIDTTYTERVEAKLSGFGDLFVAPLGLSWGWKHFDATFYYGFTAPTGRYETGADDNIGLGFWTHQFQGFGYWYPKESQTTAFMLGLTYELNSKIKGEDFNPGNRFSLEYGLSQYITERFEISFMGGNNWQISDDKGEEVNWNAAVHDRKGTLGFSAAVWAVKERLYVGARYMFDYGAIQRFYTPGFMVNLIFVTNAMDGIKSNKKSTN